MSKRLRALNGMTYPIGSSLELVRKAGGISKLTDDQRASLKVRRVQSGEWCDDLPAESVDGLVASRDVEVVEVKERKEARDGR